jgi:hypothetical protein
VDLYLNEIAHMSIEILSFLTAAISYVLS